MKEQIATAIKEISRENETKENEVNMILDFLISVAREEKVDGATKSKSKNKNVGDTSRRLTLMKAQSMLK